MVNPIGINLWNWMTKLDASAVSLIPEIKSIGFDSVEIPIDTLDFDYRPLRSAIRDANLKVSFCVSMGSGRDISSFDPEYRANALEYLRACCRCVEAFGGGVICGPIYTGGGKAHVLNSEDRQMEWNYAVENLRSIAEFASGCGVSIAIEPINRYRTSVVNTANQAIAMAEQIGCENVGILFDTYQANIEESNLHDSLEAVLRSGKLFHFHACENHRGVPGTGHIPWNTLLPLLKQYRYAGHITMETFIPGGLDACWNAPADSPDVRAASGLKYLKSILADWEAAL